MTRQRRVEGENEDTWDTAYLRLERLPSDKRPEGSQRRFHESYRQAGRPKDGMWLVSKWCRCVGVGISSLSLSLSCFSK